MFRVAFVFLLLIGSVNLVNAHPGGTAADGCHYCWTNCAQWGEVEGARHCHGNNIEELSPKFTPISHHEENNKDASNEVSKAEKFAATLFRGFFFAEDADKFIKIYDKMEYFYCEGKGKYTSTLVNNNTSMDLMPGHVFETKDDMRTEFIFAFQEKSLSKNNESNGIFATSDPKGLSNGWLVVSLKLLNSDNWINIWDKDYGVDSTPFDDSIKGTINEFVLRVDSKFEFEKDDWSCNGDLCISDVSKNLLATMNRKTKSFYQMTSDIKKIKTPEGILTINYENKFEGDCSTFKR